jgi:2-keto-4-pentenoate hydratase/2-oxohepta-3-ene-1,7-dioic acid hydratase in catechol pathway
MKLVNFSANGLERVGVRTDHGIVDLTSTLPGAPTEIIQVLGQLEHVREIAISAQHYINEASVHIFAPVRKPSKFLGVGGNFRSHIAEVAHLGIKEPKFPVWFNKQVGCVNGPFDPIWAPFDSEELDYEGEIGVVIGKRCRRVSVQQALDVLAGYVVVNDVSIRDWQMRAPTATVGKSFDTHGPFGPYLVTPDEVGDPGHLMIRTWVNGQLRQEGSTNEMIFNVAELVSDLSQRCTLEVGDVLSLGSPAGVGGLRKPPAFLKVGDVVRVEVERIGMIENTVCAEPR